MFKDALGRTILEQLLEIKPTGLANCKYETPQFAHYDGALDMNSIVEWLRNAIGMTPLRAHDHFRLFLRRAFRGFLR